MSRLIVNADDFGLTAGVNRAIFELYRSGAVTSATLMAQAAATSEAIELALSTPSLGVGCHVVLVDGDPVLPQQEIPTLVDERTGRFRQTLQSFLKSLFTGRIRSSEIKAETTAQIELLQNKGVALTHVDTHKHTHMFPAVLRPVLRAARAAGISAVRNPFEPVWSVRATPGAAWIRRVEVSLLRQLAPAFRRIVAEEGFTTADGALGVFAAGALDSQAVSSLLGNIRPGAWELVTHPGYNDSDLARANTRLLASREVELEALLRFQRKPGLELISFAGLGGSLNLPSREERPRQWVTAAEEDKK